jgi:hypothetical protein
MSREVFHISCIRSTAAKNQISSIIVAYAYLIAVVGYKDEVTSIFRLPFADIVY